MKTPETEGLFITIGRGEIVAALAEVFSRKLGEEVVQSLVAAEIRERVGSVSLETLRAEWEMPNVRAVRAKLRKLGVSIRHLGRTERVKLSDIEEVLQATAVTVAEPGAGGAKITRIEEGRPTPSKARSSAA